MDAASWWASERPERRTRSFAFSMPGDDAFAEFDSGSGGREGDAQAERPWLAPAVGADRLGPILSATLDEDVDLERLPWRPLAGCAERRLVRRAGSAFPAARAWSDGSSKGRPNSDSRAGSQEE